MGCAGRRIDREPLVSFESASSNLRAVLSGMGANAATTLAGATAPRAPADPAAARPRAVSSPAAPPPHEPPAEGLWVLQTAAERARVLEQDFDLPCVAEMGRGASRVSKETPVVVDEFPGRAFLFAS